MYKKKLICMAGILSLIFGAVAYGAVVEGRNGGPGVSIEDEAYMTAQKEQQTDMTGEISEAEKTEAKKASLVLTALGTDITRLDIPAEAEVLVVVEGRGLEASVTAYKRDAKAGDKDADTGTETGAKASDKGEIGPGAGLGTVTESKEQADAVAAYTDWQAFASTDQGKLGRKGLGKTVEGDEKTPVGIFKMNTPFGISDPEEGFPENYIKVSSDLYWNGDSASTLYNRLVSTNSYNDFNKSKSEHLIDYGGYYDYCIDMGYNPEGTPHLGSALFLHCSMGQNTGGCIAIPKDVMTVIMQNYREGKTYIAVGDASHMSDLYRSEG